MFGTADTSDLLNLLTELRSAAAATQPERELVDVLARRTGGGAEIRASWGAVVAEAGEKTGIGQSFRLQQGRRHVGRLTLWTGPEWAALGPLAADYALLSRLQSAAAGSARRRVGERTLSALLSGELPLGDEALRWHWLTLAGAKAEAPALRRRRRTRWTC